VTAPTPQQILDTPMGQNDAGVDTVRAYLAELLYLVWEHEDGFSGKRPFGNSGWQSEVHEALIRAGHLDGTFDEDGYLDDYDRREANRLVLQAIRSLGGVR
jgi:hypothetical protein